MPAADDGALGLDRHVTERLLPMLAALDRPAIVVGYCLGGNLAIGAAALHPVRALATIATPWDFDGFPTAAREEIGALWRSSKPMRSEEHTSELPSLMRNSYAVFCLKKKNNNKNTTTPTPYNQKTTK